MMINNNRAVQNAWNMLKYLYSELRSRRFAKLDITSLETLDELYGLVLTHWCENIAKEGLYKEYITIEDEELSSPRGQINVQESIIQQTLSRGKLICSYDEFSEDIYINHILKGTLLYLSMNKNFNRDLQTKIAKAMQLYNGVSYTDITKVKWKTIKYTNSNIRYKHLIELCHTMVDEQKLKITIDLKDEERLYLLFKKQLIKWYMREYEETETVEIKEVAFELPSEPLYEVKVNKRNKLIVIRNDLEVLVICIRPQTELLFEDPKLTKIHQQEFVRHLRDVKDEFKIKTSGVLMYVNLDKTKLNLQPITVNNIDGYMIGETIVDIHDQWRYIEIKLKDAYDYFIGRTKAKKKK